MAYVTVATDNFNRANGAVGANWTDVADEGQDLIISSNALLGQGGDAIGYWNANSFNDDQYAQAKIVTPGNYSGVILRAIPAGNDYIMFQYNGTDVVIVWFDDYGFQFVAGASYTVVGNDVIRGEVIGTAASLYVNGALKCSGTLPVGAPTSGSAGIICSSTDVVDDWEGGNIVADASTGPGYIGGGFF